MRKEPDTAHIAYMQALKASMVHVRDTPVAEILAVASQYVGMLLAFQDMHAMTPEQGVELIMRNIEIGNQMVISTASVAGNA